MIIPRELFRKYIAYAKKKYFPQLTEEAIEEIKHFYVELRNKPVASESAMRPIPISARQLQALVRMAEASAKIRLQKEVTRDDARVAIELMKYYLMQVGYDYESKTFDIDKATTSMTSGKRSKILSVLHVITELEDRIGKMIPFEELEKEFEGKLKTFEIEEAINELKKRGDHYEPRKGYISKTG